MKKKKHIQFKQNYHVIYILRFNRVEEFIQQSNLIEGVDKEVTKNDLSMMADFLFSPKLDARFVIRRFMRHFFSGAKVRCVDDGLTIVVGDRECERNSEEISKKFNILLQKIHTADPYLFHHQIERLQPFTFGNGFLARALWLYQMLQRNHGEYVCRYLFLTGYYYQSIQYHNKIQDKKDKRKIRIVNKA